MKSRKTILNKVMPVSDSDTGKQKRKGKGMARKSLFLAMLILTFYMNACPVFASDAANAITDKIGIVGDILGAIVQSFGGVVLIWAAFELGNSMQQQEGGATSRALIKMVGGLIMVVVTTLVAAMVG